MTEDAFLRAIADEPHDDAHQFAYANRLDDPSLTREAASRLRRPAAAAGPLLRPRRGQPPGLRRRHLPALAGPSVRRRPPALPPEPGRGHTGPATALPPEPRRARRGSAAGSGRRL